MLTFQSGQINIQQLDPRPSFTYARESRGQSECCLGPLHAINFPMSGKRDTAQRDVLESTSGELLRRMSTIETAKVLRHVATGFPFEKEQQSGKDFAVG